MASHTSPDPHIFTPPHEHHSPTKHDELFSITNGTSLPPAEIPKRESVPSASEVPPQMSPPAELQHFSTASSTSTVNGASPPPPWLPGVGSSSQAVTSPQPGGTNYLDLYELKQAQLEQAERRHKEQMEEVLRARTKAEELAEKIQDELRQEVKSVRKVEESLRDKVEEQLRREREAWNTEREILMQKMKVMEDQNALAARVRHQEQENEALRVKVEQLKHRLRACEANGIGSGELSPSYNSITDVYSPTRRRIASPDGRTGRQTSVDRYAFFTSRRPTPNTLKLQEAPYAPPASVIPPLSPPPPSYRRHAGHTPGASVALMSPPAFDQEHQDGSDTPRPNKFGSLAGLAAQNGNGASQASREETLRRANQELLEATDDPPLKGPLGLKNNPDDSSLFLDLLSKKLTDVSEDPASNAPKVLRRDTDDLSVISESIDGQSTIDADENPKTAAAVDTAHKEKADDEEPIPLRLKPSMNFGAPLGHVRSG